MMMLYREEVGKERVRRVANLICAFPFVLADHLGSRVTDNYSHLITRDDLLLLNRVGNRPLALLNTLGIELKQIKDKTDKEEENILFSSRERLAMMSFGDKLTKAVGACERLVQTPVPLNYARHTSRFLSMWCLTVPLALVGEMGFGIVPVMGLMAWGLFGIQEIGLMIEEPFRRALRLDIFTRTIYADVQETTYLPEWLQRGRLERTAERTRRATALKQQRDGVDLEPDEGATENGGSAEGAGAQSLQEKEKHELNVVKRWWDLVSQPLSGGEETRRWNLQPEPEDPRTPLD